MTHAPRQFTRFSLVTALALLSAGACLAQTPAPAQSGTAPVASGRPDQAIQRIRTEDAGARIDELRVGGETQQITVQPKANVPAYEVKPAEGARGTAPAASGGDTNGARVWNFLKF